MSEPTAAELIEGIKAKLPKWREWFPNEDSIVDISRRDLLVIVAEAEQAARLRKAIESFGNNPAGFDWAVSARHGPKKTPRSTRPEKPGDRAEAAPGGQPMTEHTPPTAEELTKPTTVLYCDTCAQKCGFKREEAIGGTFLIEPCQLCDQSHFLREYRSSVSAAFIRNDVK